VSFVVSRSDDVTVLDVSDYDPPRLTWKKGVAETVSFEVSFEIGRGGMSRVADCSSAPMFGHLLFL
jgi:hypothetical protein